MAQRLPKLWWDVVLDGGTYRIDLASTQFANMTALRSACYREAEARHCLVATHKAGVKTLVVQAWGNETLGTYSAPALANATAEPAPTIAAASPRARTHVCDCGQGPITHPLTCSLWGAPKVQPRSARPAPAPQDQPSTPTSEPLEADDEALLGPCTCGQSPQCLPDCARVTGLVA